MCPIESVIFFKNQIVNSSQSTVRYKCSSIWNGLFKKIKIKLKQIFCQKLKLNLYYYAVNSVFCSPFSIFPFHYSRILSTTTTRLGRVNLCLIHKTFVYCTSSKRRQNVWTFMLCRQSRKVVMHLCNTVSTVIIVYVYSCQCRQRLSNKSRDSLSIIVNIFNLLHIYVY